MLRPSEAIACVCRKAYNPVGCIDRGCWLILLYWHVLMLSHCLTNRLRSKVKAHLAHCREKKGYQSLFYHFFYQRWHRNNFFFVWYLNRLASSYNICYNNLAIIYFCVSNIFCYKSAEKGFVKKNKNNICSHTFCDFILLWWIPHGAPIAIFATFSSVIFRYSYTNIVSTNKKASGLIFWCSFLPLEQFPQPNFCFLFEHPHVFTQYGQRSLLKLW